MFSKYGKFKFAEEKKKEEFSKIFHQKYAVPLLESNLTLLLRRKTNFVGSKCLNYAINYVCEATRKPVTINNLKPFVERLIYEVIIAPIMLINQEDVRLFKE
jgi:hypothetical protein